MRNTLRAFFCAGVLAGIPYSPAIASEPTGDQVRQILIQDSIANYPGNCPCPYNVDYAGRRCGKYRAYFRPGGHAPVCYAQDVTKEIVERYRERQ
ncbi:MAG TPA: hypothetical protein VF275_11445 [Gammaproteobacteria bacterium]